MSLTAQDARIGRAIVVVLVLAPLVGAGAWLLIWAAIRVGHDIPHCDHNCPPEGGRHALAPASGIVLNVMCGIAFTDRTGTPRRQVVPVRQKLPEVWAWYRVHDPSRVRLAPVWFAVLKQ